MKNIAEKEEGNNIVYKYSEKFENKNTNDVSRFIESVVLWGGKVKYITSFKDKKNILLSQWFCYIENILVFDTWKMKMNDVSRFIESVVLWVKG